MLRVGDKVDALLQDREWYLYYGRIYPMTVVKRVGDYQYKLSFDAYDKSDENSTDVFELKNIFRRRDVCENVRRYQVGEQVHMKVYRD